MKKQLSSIAFLFVAAIAVLASGSSAQGSSYTDLDHPSEPCRLSVEAVANWGETSAHLPQACTYGE
jgi:hypothetical protein